ncbi:MAG TPA: hypothetical protein VGH20_07380 [Myxococcales bacterium]|jgi:hypothetical protein
MTKAMLAAAVLLCAACGNGDCDKASLSGTCSYPTALAQCVEFSGLSTADSRSAATACANRGGTWNGAPDGGGSPCSTAGEVGVCVLPPTTPSIDITCSPNGVVHEHFFAPTTAASAQQTCSAIKGATFTPG